MHILTIQKCTRVVPNMGETLPSGNAHIGLFLSTLDG